MMKAVIKFRNTKYQSSERTKTIEVRKNEPNSIIREFLEVTGLPDSVYIRVIKCGLTSYEWKGYAHEALLKGDVV